MSVPDRRARQSRRRFFGTAVGLLGVALYARLSAAQGARTLSGLRVDTRPLAARGAAVPAQLIQRLMSGKLQSVFGDLVTAGDRRGPMLVARIDTLYLSDFVDAAPPGFGNHSTDFMDGAGILTGAAQPAVTPLHVTLPASYSGAYYLPDIDVRRIDSLCYQFAYWLRREMNL